MGSYGVLWGPMGFYGVLRGPMGSYGAFSMTEILIFRVAKKYRITVVIDKIVAHTLSLLCCWSCST